jgi:signal peptidase II
MEHKRSRLLQLIALVCLLVVVDQVTKSIVRKAFTPGGSIPLIGDVLRITFVQNFEGFSWWVPTLPLWVKSAFRVVLICIALLAFPVYSLYTQTRRQSTWADIAVAGITASALGHLVDDLFVPYTTDFFQVFHSPSANLADVYSYVGIGALAVEMIYVFRVRKRKGKAFRHLLVDAVRTRKEFLEFILRGPAECMNRNRGIEPMPFWQSLVLFGIPGIIVYLNIYVGVPYLVGVGVPLIICFPPLLLLPVLLPASLVIYRHEGNEMSWAGAVPQKLYQ